MENGLYTVCIYMSTYNGEKYIREQIDSILHQKGVKVVICIRDDGSKDHTVELIEEYVKKGYPIILERGNNIGFAKSFLQVSHKKVEADYYAFSDQDDIWKENKLIRAVRMIKSGEGAILYGGNIFITDENLRYRGVWCNNKNYEVMRERIFRYYPLGYNLYGCSMVWNRELQEYVWRHMPQNDVGSHDVYMAIMAGALGKILVDKKPMTFHRLHGSNTAGIESNIIKRGIKGYKLYLSKNCCKISKISKEVIEYYRNDLHAKKEYGIETLFCIADYKSNKIRLLRQLDINVLGIRRYLWIMLRIMMNRY